MHCCKLQQIQEGNKSACKTEVLDPVLQSDGATLHLLDAHYANHFDAGEDDQPQHHKAGGMCWQP